MTERREKPNISAILAANAQWIDNIYREKSSTLDPSSLEADKTKIEKAKRRVQEAKTPLEKRLSNLELVLTRLECRDRRTTVGLLSMASVIADTMVMIDRYMKPTQEQELKMAKEDLGKYVVKRKKDFDKHLAKRVAKLFDTKGHEAMYGASGRSR